MSLIILDLDGTLADSKKDLAASVNYVRNKFDLESLTEEKIGGLIGNGAPLLMHRVLEAKASDGNVQEALQMFLAYYRLHMFDQTALYPGVRETLEALADCKLAVLTNKPVRVSCAMLEGLGIYKFFSVVYGGNSFEQKKPDPVGVFRILSDTDSLPEEAWMVGDSAVDVLTGRNAGVRTCGVTYGYASHTFSDVPPDFLIDRFSALERLVRGIKRSPD